MCNFLLVLFITTPHLVWYADCMTDRSSRKRCSSQELSLYLRSYLKAKTPRRVKYRNKKHRSTVYVDLALFLQRFDHINLIIFWMKIKILSPCLVRALISSYAILLSIFWADDNCVFEQDPGSPIRKNLNRKHCDLTCYLTLDSSNMSWSISFCIMLRESCERTFKGFLINLTKIFNFLNNFINSIIVIS